jgi:hypothetical protein
MSDGALRGTSEDPDAAISNQPEVSVPIELALQPPSEGTGSVVSGMRTGPGPHTLMTAGHVVYIKNSGVPVCPRSRSSSRAWSAVLPASKWRRPACSSPEASRGVGRRAPIGVDRDAIADTDLGNTVGWFGFGVWPDADLRSAVANISGYPGMRSRASPKGMPPPLRP